MLRASPSASDRDIGAAFRQRSMETLPDEETRNPCVTARQQAINDAERILADPELRAGYDRLLGIRNSTARQHSGGSTSSRRSRPPKRTQFADPAQPLPPPSFPDPLGGFNWGFQWPPGSFPIQAPASFLLYTARML